VAAGGRKIVDEEAKTHYHIFASQETILRESDYCDDRPVSCDDEGDNRGDKGACSAK
jgi:hypothetical protein